MSNAIGPCVSHGCESSSCESCQNIPAIGTVVSFYLNGCAISSLVHFILWNVFIFAMKIVFYCLFVPFAKEVMQAN